MVDAGLTVIQDSIGSATPENTGELIKFSHANNNNNLLSTPPVLQAGHFTAFAVQQYSLLSTLTLSLSSLHQVDVDWTVLDFRLIKFLDTSFVGGFSRVCFSFAFFWDCVEFLPEPTCRFEKLAALSPCRLLVGLFEWLPTTLSMLVVTT